MTAQFYRWRKSYIRPSPFYVREFPIVHHPPRDEISHQILFYPRNISLPLYHLEKSSSNPIALCGDWDFVMVKKGASDLRFADRVIPTYPSEVAPHKISFNEKGKLENDPYPHGWDEIDWEVYYIMKDPSISYIDAVRKSKKEGISATF